MSRSSTKKEKTTFLSRPAEKVVGIYALLALAWILLSDWVSYALFGGPKSQILVQDLKGGLFVLATSLLLWFLVKKALAEQEHSRERLQQRESLLQGIVNGTNDLIFAKDMQGRYLLFNRAAEEFTGTSAGEALGKDDGALFSPEKAASIQREDARVLESGQVVRYEETLPDRTGESRTLQTTKGPLLNDAGKPSGLFGITRDISEEKVATDALKERVKEQNCLIGVVETVNDLELSTAEIVQRTANLLPPGFQFPDITCARITLDNQTFTTEDFSETEWVLSCPIDIAGNQRGILEVFYREKRPEAAIGPFLEEEQRLLEGAAERLASAIHRRETRTSLQATRLRLQHLLAVTPGAIYAASSALPYGATFISDNVQELTGYEPQRFLDNPDFWLEHIHPGDRETVTRALQHLEREKSTSYEYRFRCDDGHWRWFLDSARLLTDEQGRPTEVVGSWIDITELKKSEKELARLNRTLRVISSCNEALVRSESEEELIDAILQQLVVSGGYPIAMTWFPGEEAGSFTRNIFPESAEELFSQKHRDDCGTITLLEKVCPDPFSREIPLADGSICEDECCRDLKRKFDIISGYSLPLKLKNEHLGCLLLFSADEGFFSEEVYLLKELADDLTYGLKSLRTREAHHEAQEGLRLRNRAIEASVNGIMISEARPNDAPLIYVNHAFERITGYQPEEVLGRDPAFLSGQDRDQKGLVDIRAAIRAERTKTALVRNYRKDGSLFWNDLSIAPVRNDRGEVTHYVSIINDVTELKQYEKELERQSNYDTLTGLANRNLLYDRLKQAVGHARRSGEHGAILLLNLDRFKIINDSLGFSLGNELLKRVAERLQDCVRTHNTLARLAADEFVLVVEAVKDRTDLTKVIEKIRKVLAPPYTVGTRSLEITASIGIALFPDDADEPDTLITQCGLAMYHAKEAGHGEFRFFSAGMDTRVQETMDLEADIRRALEREEFLLYFQPKVDVQSGRIVGSEALARWCHPERGIVSPGAFIPLAEETGLIEPLGAWGLAEACRTIKAFQEQGLPPIPVSVNLSARQFRNKKLKEEIKRTLEETGLEPQWLELELTESMVMDRPEEAIRLMAELKELGITLSLDDFGTGYSSLNYLRRLPADVLKIDRTFISDVVEDESAASVADSIIDIAHNLGLKAVAEGVETEAQLHFLRSCRCDIYQGFLFSKPVPADEFLALLQQDAENQA